jgi:two-component system, CAI-1 autoinducer sensor kinase/phosphatase CqsS
MGNQRTTSRLSWIRRIEASKLLTAISKFRFGVKPKLQWLREEVINAPLEPILHPSSRRIWWLGLSIFAGNAVFAWIWSVWLPQQYENLALRFIASILGLTLMVSRINHDPDSLLAQRVFSIVFWLELPVFFSWMYLCNSGNPVWLATTASMLLIYYLVTDWRLATLGTINGFLLSLMVFTLAGPTVAPFPDGQVAVHVIVFAFTWSIALLLNLSSANLRRSQLSHTLATIGIMAHELRTPLSTAALLGDAMQMEATLWPNSPLAPQIHKLAVRLQRVVRNMNHQIDTQISNAKLRQLPRPTELVSATRLVTDAVANYPYAGSLQEHCVQVVIHDEFTFRSCSRQFSQVLDNLIKNALYSLMAADSSYAPGALRIEISAHKNYGTITIEDDGVGIKPEALQQIFKPFFSSNKDTGHGLGLAFCQQVIQSAGGSISVKSRFAVGAIFLIALPIATPIAKPIAK